MVTKRTPTPRKASSLRQSVQRSERASDIADVQDARIRTAERVAARVDADGAEETVPEARLRRTDDRVARTSTASSRGSTVGARTSAVGSRGSTAGGRTSTSRASSTSRSASIDGQSPVSNILAYFDENRHVPLFILAALAALMLLILLFSRCGASKVEEEPMPDASVLEAEQTQEEVIAPPSNPAAKVSLNDYTWDEISQISAKIASATSDSDAIYVAKQYNLVRSDGTLDPTATKAIELTDGTSAVVRIIGFNQDAKSDGSGRAGITFMFADPVTSMAYNESGTIDGGWAASDISYYLGVDFWSQLPEDLTMQISEVTKRTNSPDGVVEEEYTEEGEEGEEGSTTTTTNTAASTIAESGDIMWLPSYVEIMGQGSAALGQEGSQYQLFRERGSVSTTVVATTEGTDDAAAEEGAEDTQDAESDGQATTSEPDLINNTGSLFIMRSGEQTANWWLRSMDADTNSVYYVNTSGSAATATADNAYAVAPCFSI